MSNQLTEVCAACGADDTGTAFCESCGASMAAARVAPIAEPPASPAEPVAEPSAPSAAPISDHPAFPVAPLAVTSSIGLATALRASTLVFLFSAVSVPTLFGLAVSGINGGALGYGYGWYGSGIVQLMGGILGGLAGVAAIAAALVSPVSVSRRVGGAIIALLGAVLLVPAGFVGYFSPSTAALIGLFFFLAWALTRPIAGLGFVAIPIMLVSSYILSFVPIYFLPAIAANLIQAALAVAVLGGGIAIARKLERRRAERLGYAFDARAGLEAWPVSARPSTGATYSLVFSLLGVSLAGVIFGHIAIARLPRTGESGRGLAIAGVVVGYVGIVASLVGAIVFVATQAALIGSYYLPYRYGGE